MTVRPFWPSVRLLAGKDLRREWRSRAALQAGLLVVLLFAVLDLFAFQGQPLAAGAAAAALWTPVVFATAALVGRGLPTEADRGTLDLLRSSAAPLAAHGVARTLVNAGAALALALVAQGVLAFGFGVAAPPAAILAVTLGTLALATLGTLASALAAQARARDTLLPLILVPLAAPILQAGMRATALAAQGATWSDLDVPLLLLAADLVLAVGAGTMLWTFLLEGD